MADNTKIEWADATVNAINGCSVTSPGCTNCYAMKLAGTRMKSHPTREGLTIETKAGPVWNGEVRLHEPALLQPLSWSKPRRIFWNAHGDPFHPAVPHSWVDRVFAVAALTPQHTHMILTKRSDRMREWANAPNRARTVWSSVNDLLDDWDESKLQVRLRHLDGSPLLFALGAAGAAWGGEEPWPLPNVWLGVSVEDQTRADERIPDLLATPAAVRFLSCEPLLGPVDLTKIVLRREGQLPSELSAKLGDYVQPLRGNFTDSPKIDWVIAGGESGPGARPMHPDWARSLRDQCAAAGVPFHFKQWGEWRDQGRDVPIPRRDHQSHICHLDKDSGKCKPNPNRFSDETMIKLGKGKSGRLLDGVEHNGMPGGEK